MEKKEDYTEKSRAIETLVTASEENTGEYTEEELSRYRSKSRFSLPPSSKALLLKFWFSGAVCYFFVWGLGLYIPSSLDLYFATSLGMGFVKDILENNFLRFIAERKGANDRWMMWPKKSFGSLILNVLHSFSVVFLVYLTYTMINVLLLKLTKRSGVVLFAMEPLTFGLFFLGYDLLLIRMKHLLMKIVKDAENKAKGDN